MLPASVTDRILASDYGQISFVEEKAATVGITESSAA